MQTKESESNLDEKESEYCYSQKESRQRDEMTNDIAYILGEPHTYTWDEFYEVMELERAEGKIRCPQASMIALEILKGWILQMPYRSNRTNSDTHNDLIQNAYLVITEHIPDFDRSQSSFKTYISKWLTGLVRETRDDGVSNYQRNQMGINIVSADAMSIKDDGKEVPMEFEDEKLSIETLMRNKENIRTQRVFEKVLGRDCETIESALAEDSQVRRDIYTNAACYSLFLGGVGNLPEGMDETLESVALGE